MTMGAASGFTIDAFEAGNIDVEAFDHEAHVFVAWLYLDACSTAEAIDRFTSALKRLTVQLGIAAKYHETITWFFMLAIAERRQPGEEWTEFRQENPDLFNTSDSILARYYSKETLASERARSIFVLPQPRAA